MTIDEWIKHCEEVAEELEEEAAKYCCDDTEIMNKCYERAKEHRQLVDLLKELEAYRKLYSLDNDIKTTLNEIHDIHERIRQCNERYEKRMAELERPVEFYDINGPLKITREEDNNG